MAPKNGSINGKLLSLRDVLENIGSSIKDKRKNKSKYTDKLKGILTKAQFVDGLISKSGYVRDSDGNSCNLDHKFHTNIPIEAARNPCYGREQNRFDENAESYCNSDKIRGSWKKSDGGACVPPRRQHICDHNLEYLNNNNTDDTDDLLGNVLVTAKYEGESIVTKHPNKTSSDLCTSLARSFADIGDIVRGIDMFKPNPEDKVQKGLKVVFRKINNGLNESKINDYNEETGNYYKLREDWWTANRDQVWKAITCKAPQEANYFKNVAGNIQAFTSEGQCGHNQGSVPTNLDYVPQFLRWFEEWAEEFCRIKKIKIDKTKDECIGENNGKNCSREGYYCKETNLKRNEIFMDLKCPDCEKACTNYNKWIENKKKEFNKQKKKYEVEHNGTLSDGNVVNGSYDKRFYDQLKGVYNKHDSFFELMNKGKICENVKKKIKIDYNEPEKTFSSSEYCKSCPIFDLKCENEQCNSLNEIKCPNIQAIPNIKTYKIEKPIDINMLVNNNKKKEISPDLKRYFNDCDLFKKLEEQKWNCEYKCNLDVCELQNFPNGIDDEKVMLIGVLIKRWFVYFLTDYSKIKENLNHCINKEKNEVVCIKDCYKNCECVEKWITKKREEWQNIKDGYIKQYISKDEDVSSKLKSFLKQGLFPKYIENALGTGETLDNMNESDGCNVPNKANGTPCNHNDVINILLNRLENKMKICKNKHDEKIHANSCDTTTKIINDDFDEDEEDEELHTTKNPCVTVGDDTRGSSGKITSVRRVVKRMQQVNDGRDDGDIRKLKADAKLGQYNNRGSKGSRLKTECDITIEHSNAERKNSAYKYAGPCTGKGNNENRLEIGKEWKDGSQIQFPKDDYMPPRRQHMCTSNLENLQVHKVTGNNKVNDTFLGDVLLAAKYEAENIKKRYQQNEGKKGLNDENDKATVCRAMKYSFADIGDIIRGKDMWVLNRDARKLQNNLKNIFAKIKEQNGGNTGKYKDDENPYTKLRSDWWSANRDQVWKAMQCKTANVDFPCKSVSTPYDDYIPQRLRWMTEWAEWYCKIQSQEYDKLKMCEDCKVDSGKCEKGNDQCDKCKAACNEYKKKVKKWEDQWKHIKQKYYDLYEKAKQNDVRADKNGNNPAEKDADVVKFLSELYKANNGKSGANIDVYGTAARYVHQELPNMDCQKQTHFCNKNSDGRDKEYAFRSVPQEHEYKCNCKDDTPTQKKKKEDVCDIAKTHIQGSKGGRTRVDGCGPKTDGIYPDWDCTNKNVNTEHNGACMPPRRQKLCVSSLTQQGRIKAIEDIRTEFIKSAAMETHFAWYKYKKDNNKAESELKSGKIPDDFLRSMKYTFGDYRDIFFGTDISSCPNIESTSNNIKSKLGDITKNKKGDKHIEDNKKREEWWTKHGKEIWTGMLCALPGTGNFKNIPDYNNPPEDFTKKPQFLRWMIEWGEDFCKKRKEKVDKLVEDCKECKVSDNVKDAEGTKTCETNSQGCKKCREECVSYKKWLGKWQDDYKKQKDKFLKDKKDYQDAKNSDHAYEYLKKQLANIPCTNGTINGKCVYKCMDDKSISSTDDMPKSLDNEPEEVEGKCSCTPPPKACEIVQNIFDDKTGTHFNNACSQKYNNGKELFTQWKCINDTTSSPSVDTPTTSPTSTSTCIPPRRQKLYVKPLGDLGGENTEVGAKAKVISPLDLRKAFIEAAAVETFFAWHKFKKDKEKKKKPHDQSGGAAHLLLQEEDDDDEVEKPQDILDGGTIPEEFKRQMFYTFGDYRDIFFGKDVGNGNDLGKDSDTKSISEKISSILYAASQTSSKKPNNEHEEWWNQNGKAIWDGMICALSYKTETRTKDENVYKQLNSGAKKNDYEYNKVIISSIPISTGGPSTDKTSTTLSKFAERPQFIRWMEEWGQEFCRKRKDKLKKIKKECRGKYEDKYCSGDGHDCQVPDLKHNDMFTDIYCSDCQEECRNYKRWIEKKVEEFYKQKLIYRKEYDKIKVNLNNQHYNEFYQKLIEKDYSSIDKFLELLYHCKNGKDNSDQDNEIDFTKPFKIFSPSTYCKTCPLHGVNCAGRNECKEDKDKKPTWEDVLNAENRNHENTTDINVNMIDRRGQYMQESLQNSFKGSSLLKSVRDQKWLCSFIDKEMDVCKLNNFKDSIDINKYITFKVLLQHWLQDFLEGYYISKRKIDLCTKKEETNCIKGCTKKCEYVEEWLKQKQEEWNKIKEHYNKKDYGEGYPIAYKVISYFEKILSDVNKSINNFEDLKEIYEYEDCNSHNNCIKGEKKRKKDIVTLLLSKLQDKITSCKTQHNNTPPKMCENPPHSDETLTPLDDDNPVDAPQTAPWFCPKELESPKDGPCDIVEKILKDKGEKDNIGNCKVKYEDGIYPEWVCDPSKIKNEEEGVCMPPRRQNLCLYYLTQNINEKQKLREAFIKTAAAETFLLWHYYKIKNGEYAEKNLKEGIIPPEFLRTMFYTFGDYRDLCLDTDISAKSAGSDVHKAKNNIDRIFNNGGKTDSAQNSQYRKQWWNEYGPAIWEGMVCALTHVGGKETLTENYGYKIVKFTSISDTTLDKFAERPQFLRWYIEWGDQFCRERSVKVLELVQLCAKCDAMNGTCDKTGEACQECAKACEEYQRWLETWKGHYNKQKDKFNKDKGGYIDDSDVTISTQAYEYLSKKLTNIKCTSGTTKGDCNCMNKVSKQPPTDGSIDSMPESFDKEPPEVKGKCTCESPPKKPKVLPVTPEPKEKNKGDKVEEDGGLPEQEEEPKKPVPPSLPPTPPRRRPKKREIHHHILPQMLSISVFPLSVGIAFAGLSYFLLKKKSKSSVDLLRVLNIPKGDYEMPTLKSKNRYIPYRSGSYKGKTYIYMEGDTSGDEDKYIWDLSSSDITSSESEYEELDINDIYVPGSPKYKTLIEVVLEPSKSNGNTLGDDMVPATNTFTDEEWNQLKHDFISQYLSNTEPNNNYRSGDIPMNTESNTLYFDKPEEKPFITSIHDRDLYTGEEISYNINMVNNDNIPISDNNGKYTGIDLINDSLSGGKPIDIYDEVLKRKENELFGTNHPKHTNTHNVTKSSNSDPIDNQLNLFHTWLDKHRDMCEQWNTKENILNKLNEEWNKDNDGGNVPIDNKRLNTDVSIQIDMYDGKPKKEFTNMDTNVDTPTMDNILDDLEKYNEPFYDIFEDDVYYDVNDDNKTSTDHNNLDVSSKVQIEMDVNSKLVKEKYPISDVWDI